MENPLLLRLPAILINLSPCCVLGENEDAAEWHTTKPIISLIDQTKNRDVKRVILSYWCGPLLKYTQYLKSWKKILRFIPFRLSMLKIKIIFEIFQRVVSCSLGNFEFCLRWVILVSSFSIFFRLCGLVLSRRSILDCSFYAHHVEMTSPMDLRNVLNTTSPDRWWSGVGRRFLQNVYRFLSFDL